MTQARRPYRKNRGCQPHSANPSHCRRAAYLPLSRGLSFVEPRSARRCKANGQHEAGAPDMQNGWLTLERHAARRPGQTHDGVVVRCIEISDGAPITSSCMPGTARSSVCCSCSMPAMGRSSPGWLSPKPASRARWCLISWSQRRRRFGANHARSSHPFAVLSA
jgi:hypothetical protein